MNLNCWYIWLSCTILSFMSDIRAQQASRPVLLVIGTRPDCIKMAPVYHALKRQNIPTYICATGQHIDLVKDIFSLFDMMPHYDLAIMRPGQDLFYTTQEILAGIKKVCQEVNPALVLVQGDTTTAMAAALAAFYLTIPVGHIEAGLRTHDIRFPFPEELNRRIITLIASYHFAPTQLAVDNLLAENIPSIKIFCTGNTVVDALHTVHAKIAQGDVQPSELVKQSIAHSQEQNKKIILFTMHRREAFAESLYKVFMAIAQLLENPNITILYPMHPNPAIARIFAQTPLQHMANLVVMPPLSYVDMVYVLSNAEVVLTDSGGLQEEAISLNKPVLVLRKETERMEGVYAGLARLVGDDQDMILSQIDALLTNKTRIVAAANIYGNGTAAERIAQIVQEILSS